MRNFDLPWFGGGAGLRHAHFDEILRDRPPFPWFEVIAEDFIGIGGYVQECFQEIRKHYRIIPHGVGMSIGSTDPLDWAYLEQLKRFVLSIDAPWFSDHLCFTMVDHTNLENLIPLPFSDEAVRNVVSRIKQVQEFVGLPFLVENVTRYVTVSDREMPESEFLCRILEEANCGLLLDLTNVHLNSRYHGYDEYEFLNALPLERVAQVHLAGFEGEGDEIIDSHDAPVPEPVWKLFKAFLAKAGPTSALVEWDKSLPPVQRLLDEALTADELIRSFVKEEHGASRRAVGA